MPSTADRRPWLIISKREAEAVLAVVRDYIQGAPLLDDADLVRAERVMTWQLEYIAGQHADDDGPDLIKALVRDQRA